MFIFSVFDLKYPFFIWKFVSKMKIAEMKLRT